MSETNEPPPILPYRAAEIDHGHGEDLPGSVFVFCLACYVTVAGWIAVRLIGRDLRDETPFFILFGCCTTGIVIILPAAFTLGLSLFLFRTLSRRWRYGRTNWAFALTAVVHCALVIAAWTVSSNAGSILFAGWLQLAICLLALVLIPAVAPLWLLRAAPVAG